jgi:hypothetical protein
MSIVVDDLAPCAALAAMTAFDDLRGDVFLFENSPASA